MSQVKNVVSLVCAMSLGLVVSAVAYSSASLEEALKERVKPVGNVCMVGDDCAAAPAASASSGPRSGEEVYTSTCATCHNTGISGAPKIGVADDWSARLGQGLETLYVHAIEGINAMPAKGLCMDCSDDEIKASVDYMLEGTK